jgi:signal transduction histidine kinase
MPGVELSDAQRKLFRAAGLVTWLAVGAVFPICTKGWTYIAPTLAAYLAFLALFLATTGARAPPVRLRLAALAAETGLTLVLIALHPYYLTANLIVIVGWQAALILETRDALIWIGVQTLAGALCVYPNPPIVAWPFFLAVAGFQGFGVVTARILASEHAGRRRLSLALAEATMTQTLLADAERSRERRRISRDLHDILGHELTAMILQMDVASKATPEPSATALDAARTGARRLLDKVRETVRGVHAGAPVDLAVVLPQLIAAVDQAEIRFDIDMDCRLIDEDRSLPVMRLVQEGVTNALRHGHASLIEVHVRRAAGAQALCVAVSDNGRGAAKVAPGFGLNGLRERFEALGGEFQFESSPLGGFRVQATLPFLAVQ